MGLKFIEVIDETCESSTGSCRHTTFAYGGMKDKPHHLRVIGNLPHCTNITFDKLNAQKLIDFLQERIIDREN